MLSRLIECTNIILKTEVHSRLQTMYPAHEEGNKLEKDRSRTKITHQGNCLICTRVKLIYLRQRKNYPNLETF